MDNNNIYLIGFMGVGKSTVARKLAEKTNARQLEMDAELEREQGMAITEIFSRYGEDYFRDLETELIRKLSGKYGLVVSCGGGSVLRAENAALMKKNGLIVLLTAEPETIYERVKDSKNRPVLNGRMNVGYIRELMETRRECYERAADIVVSTDGRDTEAICAEIIRLSEEKRREC